MTRSNGRCAQVCGRLVVAGMALAVPAMAVAGVDDPEVRVTRSAAGRIVLDVADDAVTVRKEITADRSVVTMTTATDRLTLTVRRGVLTVSGPRGTASMEGGVADYDRLLVVLQRSDVTAKARALLARVTDGPDTFVGQSVLVTRSILEVGTGDSSALNQHQRWVSDRAAAMAARPSRATGRPTVIRAAWSAEEQSRTAGECWDLYAQEGIRIADDFADCTEDLRWYEAHKWAGCSLIYAVRSEAAMAWFIACNGGVPFSG